MRPLPLYLLLQQRRARQLSLRRRPMRRLKQAGLLFSMLAVLALASGVIFLTWAYAGLTSDLPAITRLPTLLNPDDGLLLQPTRLYDRTGQVLLYTLNDPGGERGYLVFDPQKPNHFSPYLIQATIGSEEPGFWQSSGVAWQFLTDPEPHTIAEQVVRRLLLAAEPAGIRQALRMRLLAAQITSRYGRAQVIEWDLNSAYYGGLSYGAESAAHRYLGKSAADLNLAEAAVLAAARLAPALNPLDAPQAAIDLQKITLEKLLGLGLVDAAQANQARQAVVTFRPAEPGQAPFAPAYVNLALDQLARRLGRERLELGGIRVTTSLDTALQTQLVCTLQLQLARVEGREAGQVDPKCLAGSLLPALPGGFHPAGAGLQGSAAVLDPASGEVLAFAGDSTSRREGTSAGGHAPGTLLTPFVALSAFARGFGPASLVWDIPGLLSTEMDQSTHPDHQYSGPLRLRQALANDTLAPLQELLEQIGAANVWRLSEPLGLVGLAQSSTSDRLLLQGGSVRLLDLAQAYGTLASLGSRAGQRAGSAARLESVTLLSITDDQGRELLNPAAHESQAVLSAPLAYLVHQVLSDEPARWPSLGYPNLLEIGRPAGAKMGRTVDGSQVWTVGYTPQRLVITWLGLPANPTQAGSSTTPGQPSTSGLTLDPRAAAGIWHALIQFVSRGQGVENWKAPAGVSEISVCSPSGLLPTQACPNVVSELFLDGNEPTGPDTLYRTFQINRETNRLATIFTPSDLVEERTFLVLPEEAKTWGQLAGLPVPPQDYDRIQPPTPLADAHFSDPAQFTVVHGKVILRGTAAGSQFSYYSIQVGEGLNPSVWLPVGPQSNQPVTEGTLGTWDTGGQNGLYAIRLQVVRASQRLETAILQVTVDNQPPRLRITAPLSGQAISFDAGSIKLQVEASDSVGLQRVDFYIDDLPAGSRSAVPYSQTWAPLRGSHTLKVVAVDLAGNTSEASTSFEIK